MPEGIGCAMNSEYEKNRRQQVSFFAAEQRARDLSQTQKTKALFANKTNLAIQIARDIFPALVGIETACGRVGMGFFQHERWLVSNAHVIKHRSEIDEGIVLKRSELEIDLPEGLEKLAKNTFVSLEQSYLRTTTELTISEIKKTFLQFVNELSQQKSIGIKVTRESTLMDSDHWRLDGKPGTNGQYWVLQVQDNTGKGIKVPGMQKSASSVFAEVKVPVAIEYINGQALSKDILKSQMHAKTKEDLLVQEKTATGLQKKELQRQAGAITVSIVVGTADSCALQEYIPATIRRATTPLTLGLFAAISEDVADEKAFATISRLSSDSARLNSVNAMGDTPLMMLLNDPDLNTKLIQCTKAQLLVTYSIWDQPNTAGKTAAQILDDHPEADILRTLLS